MGPDQGAVRRASHQDCQEAGGLDRTRGGVCVATDAVEYYTASKKRQGWS